MKTGLADLALGARSRSYCVTNSFTRW